MPILALHHHRVESMLLLIPGPVSTRPELRAALNVDLAPWDNDTGPLYVSIRQRLCKIAGGTETRHATLPLQGCGHFIIEASIRTFIPVGGKILIPTTGPYSDRMTRLAREAGRVPVPLAIDPLLPTPAEAVAKALDADKSITHLGMVYSETGSGVVHDVPAICRAAGAVGRRVIVDAVSAFGALPFDLSAHPEVDAVTFTANKCLESLPGVAFAVSPIQRLVASVGNAGSWSFDLADIYDHLRRHEEGSARFTPPIQILNALNVALDVFEKEGGQPARLARYTANMRMLYQGVRGLGLVPYLSERAQGPIVVNIHAPADPAWNLQAFVDGLKRHGYLISNFYNTERPSFRVGCIGAVTPDDMRGFVAAVGAVLTELGIRERQAA
jgi:2-aminoethylphosphonate-pyruvate transaminase